MAVFGHIIWVAQKIIPRNNAAQILKQAAVTPEKLQSQLSILTNMRMTKGLNDGEIKLSPCLPQKLPGNRLNHMDIGTCSPIHRFTFNDKAEKELQ